jgi:hypothetical protein
VTCGAGVNIASNASLVATSDSGLVMVARACDNPLHSVMAAC